MTSKFTINGKTYHVNLSMLPVDISLNTFIREHAGLPATKFMCQEGGCGVCICVVTGKHPVDGEIRTWAVNSCLTLLNSCVDWAITTSEGVGNKRQGYHAIQKRLAKMNGTQCGYCSPGFVMNMYALMESQSGKLTMAEVENAFGGNICRCTGYRPILDAMKSFAADSNIELPPKCRDMEDLDLRMCSKTGELCSGSCKNAIRAALTYQDGSRWFWAKSIADIFAAFSQLNDDKYMLVAGNTAHGVYRREAAVKSFIDMNAVAELKQHKLSENTLSLGANLSLSETMDIFKVSALTPGFEYCEKLWQHFDLIANVPVRNMGTLAGNLSIKQQYKEFPSDVFIVFEALDVKVLINVTAGELIKVSLKEYLGMSMKKKVIRAFELNAYPRDRFIFDSYKIMPRAQNAHAYVNAGFLINLERPSNKVLSARICFGGIRPDFVHASDVEELLVGKPLFDQHLHVQLFKLMEKQVIANNAPPDASPEYRQKLASGLLYKLLLSQAPKVAANLSSGGELLRRPLSSGRQAFDTFEKSFPVTKPTEKHEGLIQVSGEATYANDLPVQPHQVWAALVTAKKVGATVNSIDTSQALKVPGVVAFFSAKDIPGKNAIVHNDVSFFPENEELFASGPIKYYNQPIGVIVAESNALAHQSAELVQITYSNNSREVLATLSDVLESGSADRITPTSSSMAEEMRPTDEVDVSAFGQLDLGLQYHFYMEPQTAVIVPFEGGLQVYSATQWMDLVQIVIADMLKLRLNEVQLQTHRIGGGFGGKGTRCTIPAAAGALAAYKLDRPVRIVQSLESMMNVLGKRWACHVDYNFHARNNGKIVALRCAFYEDAGCSPNETPMQHAVLLSQNCYEFSDNYVLDGSLVLTDAPSNTACRAPGSIEGIAMIENIMEHIAFKCGLDPVEVRLANLLPAHKIEPMLRHFVDSTKYKQRRTEINDFNGTNRWRKKGLGVAIMEYHMGYFGQFTATVAIYHNDGSVVVSHGGIEMGQGMNTKISQVIAYTLDVPLEMIRVEGSNTLNGANSIVTGGSIGSESVCYAVRKCCNTINERLRPVREALKNPSWRQIVGEAYTRNINLIASDHCKKGDMDPYTVCAMALTEVEVDIITGTYQVSRVDILEDAGESLNPNVDVGQIEGAFIMGLGYWTSEQCVVDKRTGELLTNRTWNYKPPGAKDIPIDFRIEMLPQSSNPTGFMRSKATGEPAICLAVTVAFALQHALQSARDDSKLEKAWVALSAPMTPERVLLNAGTNVTMFKVESTEERALD